MHHCHALNEAFNFSNHSSRKTAHDHKLVNIFVELQLLWLLCCFIVIDMQLHVTHVIGFS